VKSSAPRAFPFSLARGKLLCATSPHRTFIIYNVFLTENSRRTELLTQKKKKRPSKDDHFFLVGISTIH